MRKCWAGAALFASVAFLREILYSILFMSPHADVTVLVVCVVVDACICVPNLNPLNPPASLYGCAVVSGANRGHSSQWL